MDEVCLVGKVEAGGKFAPVKRGGSAEQAKRTLEAADARETLGCQAHMVAEFASEGARKKP